MTATYMTNMTISHMPIVIIHMTYIYIKSDQILLFKKKKSAILSLIMIELPFSIKKSAYSIINNDRIVDFNISIKKFSDSIVNNDRIADFFFY
jgi:hypothetical protein